MSVPPEVEAVAVGWVLRARNDLKAAEYLLTLADGCPFDAVCFHAQQCAEKYLKALLTSHAVAFERTITFGGCLIFALSRPDWRESCRISRN